MLAQLVGYKHQINTEKDELYMQRYLSRVSRTGLDKPNFLWSKEFLPVDAPLLDFLVEDTRSLDGWKYSRLEELELEMLNKIEVQ